NTWYLILVYYILVFLSRLNLLLYDYLHFGNKEVNLYRFTSLFLVILLNYSPNLIVNFSSISLVMESKSYLGSHPHSSLAAVSSKEFGQDSAIACLLGSTS